MRGTCLQCKQVDTVERDPQVDRRFVSRCTTVRVMKFVLAKVVHDHLGPSLMRPRASVISGCSPYLGAIVIVASVLSETQYDR